MVRKSEQVMFVAVVGVDGSVSDRSSCMCDR